MRAHSLGGGGRRLTVLAGLAVPGLLLALLATRARAQDFSVLRCPDAADMDDTGVLDLTDPIYLLASLFQGGPPPPAPGFTPGLDPTPDGLSFCSPACP